MTGDIAYTYSQYGPYVVRRLEDMNDIGLAGVLAGKFATTDGSLDAPECVPAGYVKLDRFRVKEIVFVKVR